MDKQTKTKIKNLALALRDDLEKEIKNRLDNIGIYVDKEWKDGRSLTHLSKDEIEKRKRVAAFIKREEKIGLDQKKATSEFIKEASYTWINRLLGLKCMEFFEEVRTRKKKISGSDIINVTQLYTEKYMVRFLVENSLGAMWMEMYPDSQLCNKWEYFVTDPNNSRREPKPVKEITFLDPAGGSGHFQLYAFDLFYNMYLEEGIIPKDQIPEFILRYNLHGIDIDLRAIQLSALGLYMKAKSKNPDMKVQHMNLVSADAIMLDSDILEEFLQEFKTDQTAQELIKTIWKGLENVRELGSLLKVEEQIDGVIKRQKDKRLDFFGEGTGKGWEQWKRDLLAALKRYYEKAAQTFDINKQMFANEACKGVQLLDLLEQRYDVVATNPPYMYGRNMDFSFKKNLKELYPKNNRDLYAAFIERCLQFMSKKGFIAMITQQSFISLPTYNELRKILLSEYNIRTMAHLGPHSFEDVGGEKVNTTMFTIQDKILNYERTVFLRLINEKDKDSTLKELIRKKSKDDRIFIISQNNFKIITGWPFVYWISDKIRTLFKTKNVINNVIEVANRTKTSDNDKYLRYLWECTYIGTNGHRWVIYTKGGDYNKWYGNLEFIVDWSDKAHKFLKEDPSGRITDEVFWFKEGITYTDLSSKGFNARYFPSLCVYDVSGPAIFAKNYNLFTIVGLINSELFCYLLGLLNPTMHYQTGDIARVPFHPPPPNIERRISELAQQCVNVKKDALQFLINDREFKETAIQCGYDKLKEKKGGKKMINFYSTFSASNDLLSSNSTSFVLHSLIHLNYQNNHQHNRKVNRFKIRDNVYERN